MTDKELLEEILKSIVSQPELVEVTRSTDERGVLLKVTLGNGDAGSVIGREGGTINTIRQLMRVIGAVHNSRISINLDVPTIRKTFDESSMTI
jgi:predicted RNA-binding protein YlqC (UPF0109 family)